MKPLGKDRELAGLGAPQRAVDADDIAEVEALSQLPIGAHLDLADEELKLPGHVANVDEQQLPGVSGQDNAPRGPYGGADHLPGALLGQPRAKCGPLLVGV
jgi:hypothetical protein